jgi:hypothetical protein
VARLFDCVSPESIAPEVECWNCEATCVGRGFAVVAVAVAVIVVVAFAAELGRRLRFLEFPSDDDPPRD